MKSAKNKRKEKRLIAETIYALMNDNFLAAKRSLEKTVELKLKGLVRKSLEEERKNY